MIGSCGAIRMRRSMRPYEIAEIRTEIGELLDLHLKGLRCHIGQNPNRNIFYKLFRKAYKGGAMKVGKETSLTDDALWDSLEEEWLDKLDDDDRLIAKKIPEDFLRRRHEWAYVWDIG